MRDSIFGQLPWKRRKGVFEQHLSVCINVTRTASTQITYTAFRAKTPLWIQSAVKWMQTYMWNERGTHTPYADIYTNMALLTTGLSNMSANTHTSWVTSVHSVLRGFFQKVRHFNRIHTWNTSFICVCIFNAFILNSGIFSEKYLICTVPHK